MEMIYLPIMKTYQVDGMTCGGCANKVAATLKSIDPAAVVTLDPPTAILDSRTPLATFNEALSAIGSYRLFATDAPATPKPLIARSPISEWLKTYFPLLLIMGLISLASLAAQSWMMAFMAGFYIVFGAFKLLDVPAFARAYQGYDPIAKRFVAWAYVYPFIEIALGFAFLFWIEMRLAAWIALFLSLVGIWGAAHAVMRKQTIQCACLGNVFNLPMSTVTIIENTGMAIMAAWMLFIGM